MRATGFGFSLPEFLKGIKTASGAGSYRYTWFSLPEFLKGIKTA